MLGQSVLDPALACPNIIKYGTVGQMLHMARATATVFSALVASTDNAMYTPMFRAYANKTRELIASLEKTVPSLPGGPSTTQQEQSDLCTLMVAAQQHAHEFQNLPMVAATYAGFEAALDSILEPHTPRPVKPSNGAAGMLKIVSLGAATIFVGTMGYYAWSRWRGRR